MFNIRPLKMAATKIQVRNQLWLWCYHEQWVKRHNWSWKKRQNTWNMCLVYHLGLSSCKPKIAAQNQIGNQLSHYMDTKQSENYIFKRILTKYKLKSFKKLNMRQIFWNWLIRCLNMKWTRLFLGKNWEHTRFCPQRGGRTNWFYTSRSNFVETGV